VTGHDLHLAPKSTYRLTTARGAIPGADVTKVMAASQAAISGKLATEPPDRDAASKRP
jgi:hypothetical protein